MSTKNKKHPACGEYLAENEKTRFYKPSLNFYEPDGYKVVVAIPKNPKESPNFVIVDLSDNQYIYEAQSSEQIYYRLEIIKRLKREDGK
jgi:hypothetical protein